MRQIPAKAISRSISRRDEDLRVARHANLQTPKDVAGSQQWQGGGPSFPTTIGYQQMPTKNTEEKIHRLRSPNFGFSCFTFEINIAHFLSLNSFKVQTFESQVVCLSQQICVHISIRIESKRRNKKCQKSDENIARKLILIVPTKLSIAR